MTLTCHCGDVRLTLAGPPGFINECNCTLCAKSGASWGYFHPSEVGVEGDTRRYRRADKADPTAEVRFCGVCGATTHFVLTESAVGRFGDTMLGVNMRLAAEENLKGVEVRYPDGQAWPGFGPFGYVRAARIID